MRSLNIVLFATLFLVFQPTAFSETKCPQQGLTEKLMIQKMEELVQKLPKQNDYKLKKEKISGLLELINCELERTQKLPADDSYRWLLSNYHSLLADLFTTSSCKNLEEKMTFNETHQGTYTDEPLDTKNAELAKRLAKGFCQSSSK